MSNGDPYNVDPLLCCAARVCCNRAEAREATVDLLQEMGLTSDQADKLSTAMEERGVVLMPEMMADVVRAFCDAAGTTGTSGTGGASTSGRRAGKKPKD